ncbi:MAG: hypothetical protein HOE75_06180, partial [Chloroflexi bacterium]|nr:hypothetical protein [Chloroflexota bacterium]
PDKEAEAPVGAVTLEIPEEVAAAATDDAVAEAAPESDTSEEKSEG